jgi:hypothetical protein
VTNTTFIHVCMILGQLASPWAPAVPDSCGLISTLTFCFEKVASKLQLRQSAADPLNRAAWTMIIT